MIPEAPAPLEIPGPVARIPSLVAACAPLLTPLCASGAAFLPPLGSPAAPFLTAFCA